MFRSLAGHIRRHDWFAVLVEFVLVVAGVLLGVLLANVIERERVRHTGDTYLEGLGADYGVYQALLVCRMDGTASVADGLTRLVEVIDGAEMTEADRAAIIAALGFSHTAQTGLPIEGNTSALISGALVETIADEELRGVILGAQSVSTTTVGQMAFIQMALMATPRLDRYTTRTLLRDGPGGMSVYAVTDFDVDAMRADPQVRDTLVNLVNIHRSSEFADTLLISWVDRVLRRLEALSHVEDASRPEDCIFNSEAG